MPLFPAGCIRSLAARLLVAPHTSIRLSVAVWVAVCLILAGCGSKRIDSSPAAPVVVGEQKEAYLPPDDGKPLSAEEMKALLSVGDFDRAIRNEDMPDVVLHFKYYLHQGRRTVIRNAARAELYLPYIRSVLQQKNLPGDLAYLPFIESGYDPSARSRSGALGIWQFIRGTGDAYGMRRDWWSDERRCPYKSTEAAAEYLGKLHNQLKDWHLAITAYNAGRGKVSRALAATGTDNFFELRRRNSQVPEKDRLSEENKQYLPRFLAACKIMRNLGALGFAEIEGAGARQASEIHVRPSTDLLSMSRRLGMSWDEFSAYNPASLRYISPPDRSTRVYVPSRLAAKAAELARNPGKDEAGWIKYTVRKGDTLASIASRTGVPAFELRRVNQGEFKAGKVLRIPRSDASRHIADASAVQASAPGAAEAVRSGGREHVVKPGDTVYGLSRTWNVTPEAIMKANNLSGSALSIGQRLVIPGTAATQAPAMAKPAQTGLKSSAAGAKTITYTVQPGDTVWGIARKFDVAPADLMRANNLPPNSTIRPGDVVRVVRN